MTIEDLKKEEIAVMCDSWEQASIFCFHYPECRRPLNYPVVVYWNSYLKSFSWAIPDNIEGYRKISFPLFNPQSK